MKIFFKTLCLPIVFMFLTIPVFAKLTARQIVDKSYNLEDGKDMRAIMIMKIVKPSGKTKTRNLNFYRKDFGKDNRTLIVFRSPADVKGTSFLTWNNKDKENDQWLYLPALKRVRRIAASNKSKSFMGSDFSFEDLSSRSINEDTFKLLKEEKFKGFSCYVVEAKAKKDNEKFIKRKYWIRHDNFLIVKSEFYDKSNDLSKVFTADNIKKINNIWTVLTLKMENFKTKRYSTMELSDIKYNTNVSGRMFKAQNLRH